MENKYKEIKQLKEEKKVKVLKEEEEKFLREFEKVSAAHFGLKMFEIDWIGIFKKVGILMLIILVLFMILK